MLIAFLLGSDSFVASASLAPILRSRHARVRLVLLLALCDGLATLVGGALSWRLAPAWLGLITPLALAACGLWLRTSGAGAGGAPPTAGIQARMTTVIPILLSLDNLLIHQPATFGPSPEAVIGAAVASAALATTGLAVGELAARLAVRRAGLSPTRLSAVGLLASAAVLLLA